jgi:CubicO group peptidase (beta-lactamase class C family)
MKMLPTMITLALVHSAPVLAQGQVLPSVAAPHFDSQDINNWLDGLVPYALKAGDIAGAVVTVVADGQVLTTRGFGKADISTGAPVNPETTLFRAGSVSKLVTWTAVMQLVERGKLELDSDVNRYLDFTIPSFDGQPMTLRQIMTHTSGFEEQLKFVLAHDKADHLPFEELVRQYIPARLFAPGSTPAYSNYATALAGYIVQVVSGQPFDDYVDEHIFTPLGMDTATFTQDLSVEQQANLSKAYATASGTESSFEWVAASPAGSMTVAAPDMAKFMLAHLNNGALGEARILEPKTVQIMHAQANAAIPGLNGMALGFYESATNGRRVIGHGGDTMVFHSDLNLFLDDGVGIFVSVNSTGENGAAHRLRSLLLSGFADRYLPAPETVAPTAIGENNAPKLSGQWIPSRRSGSSFVALTELLQPTVLSTDAEGRLVGHNLPIVGAAVANWVEVEPFVWQAANSNERLAAVVEDGRVVRFSLDSMAPITVYDPVPWQRAAHWVTPALLASLGVLLVTAAQWPIGAMVRRHYGRQLDIRRSEKVAYYGVRASSLIVVVALAGWMVFLTSVFTDLTLLSARTDGILMVLQGLTIAGVSFLGMSAAGNAILAVRERRGLWSVLWAAALLLAAGAVTWVAFVFNLLKFSVVY